MRRKFPWTGFDLLTVVCLLVFAIGAGGCTFVEAIFERRAGPDMREPLDANEAVRINKRDMDKYRCRTGQPLVCDVTPTGTATCRCDGRIFL